MEEMFPVFLLVAAPFAVKFLLDMAPENTASWVKVLLVYAVSVLFVLGARFDAFVHAFGVEVSWLGYGLTGLLLAAISAKVAHPSVEAIRAISRIVKS